MKPKKAQALKETKFFCRLEFLIELSVPVFNKSFIQNVLY